MNFLGNKMKGRRRPPTSDEQPMRQCAALRKNSVQALAFTAGRANAAMKSRKVFM
jgi:hypothetical protein